MAAGNRHPFAYPTKPHTRRHVPEQFVNYQSYKEYLRDEFIFTCVYCLSRETWNLNSSFFGVEHFIPKSKSSAADIVKYENLLYACNFCNTVKGNESFPISMHPERNPYGHHLKIEQSGEVKALTAQGECLILMHCLNAAPLKRWRRIHLEFYERAIQMQQDSNIRAFLRDLFGFPADLTDICRRRGVKDPYCARVRPEWF
jgi:hypothetical protein